MRWTDWLRGRHDPYSWTKLERIKPYALGHIDGEASPVLIEVKNGAVVRWIFDLNPVTGEWSALMFHLIDREVESLIDGMSVGVGLLEPFRATLNNPHAIVAHRNAHGEIDAATTFEISRDQSEEQFIESAFAAVNDAVVGMTFARATHSIEWSSRTKFIADVDKISGRLTHA